MIYDLKAEGREMTTRVRPKPDFAQLVGQTGVDVILRALRVSVVNIRAKRSQFGDGRAASEGRNAQNKPNSSIGDCGFTEACGLPPGLAGLAVQTKPIARSKMCKTNPICGGRDTPPFHCSIISPFRSSGVGRGNKCAKQDACDKSHADAEFAINLYLIWIYVLFCVDRSGAVVIL
jgi:hypothetical protein